jgi:hypothetical protein
MSMSSIITPQGNFINLRDGTKPVLANNVITWTSPTQNVVEAYYSNAQAQWVFNLLSNAIDSNLNINPDFQETPLPYGALSWTSVIPSTVTHDTSFGSGTIYGTGFLGLNLGYFGIRFSWGAGPSVIVGNIATVSDTQLSLFNFIGFFPIATTVLSVDYTKDGITWTATGLTVTST